MVQWCKRTICALICFLIVGCSLSAAASDAIAATAMTGSGSPDDPYVITTAEQLYEVSLHQTAYLDKHFVLAEDVDLTGAGEWTPIGNGSQAFAGSFDGRGHRINGLLINRPSSQYVGLFGRITNASIRNLLLTNANVTGGMYTGGLVGSVSAGSTIDNCAVQGEITGSTYVGGLMGSNGGQVRNSFATGTVRANGYAGGLSGSVIGVSGQDVSGIEKSYSSSEVSALPGTKGDYLGGLIGFTSFATVRTSFAAGAVSGNPANSGGLAGYSGGTKYYDNVWDAERTGRDRSIGFINSGVQPLGNHGLTSKAMQRKDSYSDAWNFDDTWIMAEGEYPVPRTQLTLMRPLSASAVPDRLDLLKGQSATFAVIAKYDDGNTYNVTDMSSYLAQPPGVIAVSKQPEQYKVTAQDLIGNDKVNVGYEQFAFSVPITVDERQPGLFNAIATPGEVTADGRSEAVIDVVVVDQTGTPMPLVGLRLEQGAGKSSIAPDIQTTDSNGKASFAVTSTKAERVVYEVMAASDGSKLGSVAVDFKPGKASAEKSLLAPESQIVVLDGAASGEIAVTLMDEQGNLLAGHQIQLLRTDSQTASPLEQATDGGGNAVFVVTGAEAGTFAYRVRDLSDGVDLGEAVIQFVANTVDRTKSAFTATPSMVVADGRTEATLELRLNNAAGLPIADREVELYEGDIAGNPVARSVTDAGGKAAFQVSRASVASVTYTAFERTDRTSFSTTIDFVADEIEAGLSSFTVANGEVPANGSSTAEITVALKDKNGHAVRDQRVQIIPADGTDKAVITPESGMTDALGNAHFSIASTQVGVAEFKVMTPKGELGGPLRIAFADFFKQTLRAENDSYRLTVGDEAAVKVYADYQSGEREVTTLVEAHSSDPAVAAWSDGKITATGSGEALVELAYLGASIQVRVVAMARTEPGGEHPGTGPDPGNPDNPDNPDNPGSPGTPGNPANPANPGNPASPGNSGNNGNAGGSSPAKPEDGDGAKGDDAPGTSPPRPAEAFADLAGHWAEANVYQAVRMGIVQGYPNGTFKPDRAVTRAEFTVMLAQALQLSADGAAALSFRDADTWPEWAKAQIAAAWQAGIVTGYDDGTFRPGAVISRTEMAVIIVRALGARPESEVAGTAFADDAEIPSWAKGYIAIGTELGIIQGMPNGRFAPRASATRAEAATILLKLLEQGMQSN